MAMSPASVSFWRVHSAAVSSFLLLIHVTLHSSANRDHPKGLLVATDKTPPVLWATVNQKLGKRREQGVTQLQNEVSLFYTGL